MESAAGGRGRLIDFATIFIVMHSQDGVGFFPERAGMSDIIAWWNF